MLVYQRVSNRCIPMSSHVFPPLPHPHLRIPQVRAIPFWATTSTASVATSSPRMPSTIRRWRRRWNCCDRMGPTCRRKGWDGCSGCAKMNTFRLEMSQYFGDDFFYNIFFSPIIAYHCYHVRSLHIIKLPTPDQVMFFKGHFFLLLSLFLWLRAYIHLAWS